MITTKIAEMMKETISNAGTNVLTAFGVLSFTWILCEQVLDKPDLHSFKKTVE